MNRCNFTIDDFLANRKFYYDISLFDSIHEYMCGSCHEPLGKHDRFPTQLVVIQNLAIKLSDIVYAFAQSDGILKIKHKNGEFISIQYNDQKEANFILKMILS